MQKCFLVLMVSSALLVAGSYPALAGQVQYHSYGQAHTLVEVPNRLVVGTAGGAQGARAWAQAQRQGASALRAAAGITAVQAVGNGLVVIDTNQSTAREVLTVAKEVKFIYPLYRRAGSGLLVYTRPEVVVRVADGIKINQLAAQYGLSVIRSLLFTNDQFLLGLNPSASPYAIAEQLRKDPQVIWADPNIAQQRKKSFIPNDPLFPDQWHLNNIGQNGGAPGADVSAPRAWDLHQVSANTIVGICDDAIDIDHPDLNIWTNPDEIPGNRIDDDDNGLTDDVTGWDFGSNDNDPRPEVEGDWHGTSVSGVAGAKGHNALGVTGAAFGCRLIPVKLTSNGQFADEAALADGIRYAAKYSDLLNNSWGGPILGDTLAAGLDFATSAQAKRGILGVPVLFASGNSARWDQRYGLSSLDTTAHTLRLEYTKNSAARAEPAGLAVYGAVVLDESGEPIGELEISPYSTEPPPGVTLGGSAPFVIMSSTLSNSGFVYQAGAGQAGQISILTWQFTIPQENTINFLLFSFRGNTAPGQDLLRCYLDEQEQTGPGAPEVADEGLSMPFSGQSPENVAPIAGEGLHPRVISIGASTDGDVRSSYSQWGPQLKFVAPSNGGNKGITTTDVTGTGKGYNPESDYCDDFGGTSSACPLAAGVFASVLSASPALSVTQTIELLKATAVKIGGVGYNQDGFHLQYGYGRLNMQAAVQAALQSSGGTPLPTSTPITQPSETPITPTGVPTIVQPTDTFTPLATATAPALTETPAGATPTQPQPTNTLASTPASATVTPVITGTPAPEVCQGDRVLRRKVCCGVIPPSGTMQLSDPILSIATWPSIQLWCSQDSGATWKYSANPNELTVSLGYSGGVVEISGRPGDHYCLHLLYPLSSGILSPTGDLSVGPTDLLDLMQVWRQP